MSNSLARNWDHRYNDLMRLVDVITLAASEQSVRMYWDSTHFSDWRPRCPYCSGHMLYRLKDGREKCGSCRRKFSFWTGTRLAGSKLSAGKWLELVKLFELEMSARYASCAASINCKSATRAFRLIREAIAQADEGLSIDDRAQARLRNQRGHEAPGFRIQERGEEVRVEMAPNIYVSKDPSTSELENYVRAHVLTDYGRDYVNRREIVGFLDYVSDWILRHRGLAPRNFYLYVKEMEFRYNRRGKDSLFEDLVKKLVKPAPSTR